MAQFIVGVVGHHTYVTLVERAKINFRCKRRCALTNPDYSPTAMGGNFTNRTVTFVEISFDNRI